MFAGPLRAQLKLPAEWMSLAAIPLLSGSKPVIAVAEHMGMSAYDFLAQ